MQGLPGPPGPPGPVGQTGIPGESGPSVSFYLQLLYSVGMNGPTTGPVEYLILRAVVGSNILTSDWVYEVLQLGVSSLRNKMIIVFYLFQGPPGPPGPVSIDQSKAVMG